MTFDDIRLEYIPDCASKFVTFMSFIEFVFIPGDGREYVFNIKWGRHIRKESLGCGCDGLLHCWAMKHCVFVVLFNTFVIFSYASFTVFLFTYSNGV